MKLNKDNFNYIKEMISNKESLNSLKGFCKGFGLDTDNYASPVHISEDKISVRYRTNTYYVSFNHSKIYGTTYFNTLK